MSLVNFTFDWCPWLEECLQRHEDCQQGVGDIDHLPKRLIHIGMDDTICPKLVLTKDVKADRVFYVALSHSWSTIAPEYQHSLSTTVVNEFQRLQGISFEVFPPNYLAIMQICLNLGIHYMWMDCFCIIQNSEDDWKEEAPRMREIYGSAVLTISLNTTQILLTEGDSGIEPDDWAEMKQRGHESMPFAWHIPFWKLVLDGGPIGERAWCLQERHLSPRVLHLLDNGVFIFECPRAYLATNLLKFTHPRGPSYGRVRKMAIWKRLIDLEREQNSDSGLNRGASLRYWHDFLHNYQKRKLKCNKDNLIALAGIADRMRTRTGCTYLSGIWNEDIPRGLLWESTRDIPQDWSIETHTRFEAYQAPTWSWASINGSTSIIPEMRTADMDVHDVDKLPGNLFTSLVSSMYPEPGTSATSEASIAPFGEHSVLELEGVMKRYCFVACQAQSNLAWDSSDQEDDPAVLVDGNIRFDVPSEEEDGFLWCLPLVSMHGTSCFGLGLQKVNTQETTKSSDGLVKDIYRRVGLVRLTLKEGTWFDFMPQARPVSLI